MYTLCPTVFKKVDVTLLHDSPADGKLLIRLNSKQWTIAPRGDVLGCVGGYNTLSLDVAVGLARLGFWTEKEADAFCEWFIALRERTGRENLEQRAVELLQSRGYVVTRKKKEAK